MSQLLPLAYCGDQNDEELPYNTDVALSQSRKRELMSSESLYDGSKRFHEFTEDQDPDSKFGFSVVPSSPPSYPPSSPAPFAQRSGLGLGRSAGAAYDDFDDLDFPSTQTQTLTQTDAQTQTLSQTQNELPTQTHVGSYEKPETVARERIRAAIDSGDEKIVLQSMELERIPSEIGDLRDQVIVRDNECYEARNMLHLASNRIATLPPRLFEVSNMTVLSLRNNHLTEVPPAIRRMTRLRELHLAGNQLSWLPVEILDLKALEILSVFPNPLEPLPDDEPPPATPPASQVTSTEPVRLAVKDCVPQRYFPAGSPTCDPVGPASLAEICLRHVAVNVYTPRQLHSWDLPKAIRDDITAAVANRADGYECGVCHDPIAVPYGHALEWWDNVKGNREVAMRRLVCSPNCHRAWRVSVGLPAARV